MDRRHVFQGISRTVAISCSSRTDAIRCISRTEGVRNRSIAFDHFPIGVRLGQYIWFDEDFSVSFIPSNTSIPLFFSRLHSVDRTEKSIHLFQISDLHFGPPYVPQVGEAALRLAQAHPHDAIIINGDLTQRARREQFEEAKNYMSRLPQIPQLVIPGNHDVPLYRIFERLFTPHRLYREIISDELNPVLRIPGAVIVGLDSTAPRTAISNGQIFKWQLDLCDQVFRETPTDVARIVVAHHHFAPAPDHLRDSKMPNAKRAIERFSNLNVDMILGGHLHRAYIGNSLDFYPGIRRDRGIIIAQCGTTTSRRGRGREQEKNSLNKIEISKGMITITHFMYFHESDEFEMISRHAFRRGSIPEAVAKSP